MHAIVTTAALSVKDEYGNILCASERPCLAFNVTMRAGESRLFFVAAAAAAP